MNGKLLFIDRGSFSYTSFWRKRHEDRRNSSHNSPLINDWEQNTIWRDDLYYNNGEAKSFSLTEKVNENLLITGWHVVYDRFRRGLKVFRKIQWNFQERSISITDWIEGKFYDENFQLKLNFLINPIWSIDSTNCGFSFSYQKKKIFIEDPDRICFRLEQSCYCPCYQIEKNCSAIKASIFTKVGDKVHYRLKY